MSINMFMEKQKKHIVLVNTWRVVQSKGGTERVFCDLANELVLMGYQVTALCCEKKIGRPGFLLLPQVEFVNAYRKKKLHEKVYKLLKCFSFFGKVRDVKRRIFGLNWVAKILNGQICKLNQVDLFIAFQPESSYFLLKGGQNRKVITMFHFSPDVLFAKKNFEYIKDFVVRSRALTVLLPSYIEIVREKLPSCPPVICIPNAIHNFPKKSPLTGNKIVCLARLSQQKRVDLLLRAFFLIKDRFKGWIIDYWGEIDVEPKYKDEMFKLRDSLGLRGRFNFNGKTSDIESVLDSASIFVLSSKFEGFSLALGEAMSKGVPVICCRDCQGMNEIVVDGSNGFLVEPTPEALAHALELVMTNQDLKIKLGTKAKEDISNYYPEKVWGKWNSLIKCILNENTSNDVL